MHMYNTRIMHYQAQPIDIKILDLNKQIIIIILV